MIIEIESVDNIVEVVEDTVNISISEDLTHVIEIDSDDLHVIVSDAENDVTGCVQIVEESLNIALEENLIHVIEVENSPGGGGGQSPYHVIEFDYTTPSPLILVNM